ncbi:MAG: chemotaxis protein CheD [Planctomycetes bacterium]|nr:chemotaxis protein CheD [Planctomycetota bacterium]
MGELDVLSGCGVLKSLLGSCIGLVLYDERQRVGGLAHIVLPTSQGESDMPGKYADTALPELIRRIEQSGGRQRNLCAKLAGGASMFTTSNPTPIGDLNQKTVERLLSTAGIPILGRHCGGKQGRRLSFDIKTGNVTVEILGEAAVEL